MLDLRLTGLTDLVVADIYIVAFILLLVAFILAIEDESSPKLERDDAKVKSSFEDLFKLQRYYLPAS